MSMEMQQIFRHKNVKKILNENRKTRTLYNILR